MKTIYHSEKTKSSIWLSILANIIGKVIAGVTLYFLIKWLEKNESEKEK